MRLPRVRIGCCRILRNARRVCGPTDRWPICSAECRVLHQHLRVHVPAPAIGSGGRAQPFARRSGLRLFRAAPAFRCLENTGRIRRNDDSGQELPVYGLPAESDRGPSGISFPRRRLQDAHKKADGKLSERWRVLALRGVGPRAGAFPGEIHRGHGRRRTRRRSSRSFRKRHALQG